MTRRRHVTAVTGIRSEYDLLQPVLRAIEQRPECDLDVVVTGAHCSEMHGRTEKLVSEDGFRVAARVESLLSSDTLAGRVRSAGIQLTGLVQAIEQAAPDFILVAGDREEALTSAMCGAYMNIAVAHLCGGDMVAGNVDDSVRHAVSKLAHLHFTISEASRERLLKMGEEPWRTHCVGHPGIDRLMSEPAMDSASLAGALGMDALEHPLLVVVQHVISSEIGESFAQMEATLNALEMLGHSAVIIHPNSDAGRAGIVRAIESRQGRMRKTRVFRNLGRREFVNLLRNADCLVGNSSLGILEAPALNLPVVNVGNRQSGREHAGNVIFVPHDAELIAGAVCRALSDVEFRRSMKQSGNPFGDGHAGERVASVLAEVEMGRKLLVKEWTY